MSISKDHNKGFTLIEMMLAFALSSIILMGLYSAMSGTLNAKEGLDKVNNELILTQRLQRLIASDIRMVSDVKAVKPNSYAHDPLVFMKSRNSLYFNKSLEVFITYSLDNRTLYRVENQEQMDYEMSLPLLKDVNEVTVYTYDGTQYKEGYLPRGVLYKFEIKTDKFNLNFTTGRAVKI